MIDQTLGLNLGDPEETYSSSPNLYSALKIPADAKGRITVRKEAPVKSEKREERPKRERKRTKRISTQP